MDAEDTGYGGWSYGPRVDDGGVSAISSAPVATGGDGGLGGSASLGRKRRVGGFGAARDAVTACFTCPVLGLGWRFPALDGCLVVLWDVAELSAMGWVITHEIRMDDLSSQHRRECRIWFAKAAWSLYLLRCSTANF